MSLTKFAKLLDTFPRSDVHVERLPTFLEIAGYPHCSVSEPVRQKEEKS